MPRYPNPNHVPELASPDDPTASVADPELVTLQPPEALDHKQAANAEDGLPAPQRYWSAAAIWLALFLTVLDSSIANIALPTIAKDVGASPSSAIWVVNAYQIAMAVVLLPIAALGEIVTYRRVYQSGLALFIVASLGCALATDLTSLALARFAQGLGAAGVLGVNGALVRFTYPKSMLGRGVGYNAMVVALTGAMGPTVAALILSVASWQWLFAINVPLGLIAFVTATRCLPRTRRSGTRLDWVASAYSAITFLAIFMIGSDLAHGHASLRVAIETAIALGVGTLLVRHSRGQERPLLPLDLMHVPLLRLSYLTSSGAFGAQMMMMISLPFYLEAGLGFDHIKTGLLITLLPVAIGSAAPIGGRLVERIEAGLLCGIGLIVLAIGLLILAAAPTAHPLPVLIPGMIVAGFGFGFFQAPNNRTMLGHARPERSGAAAGMQAVARLAGTTGGAVMVAFLFRVFGPASISPLVTAACAALVASVVSFRRLSL